jgi:hypothetical protein
MKAGHPRPFNVIARVLSERLQGGRASEELRAIVRSSGIDWERVVGLASGQFVLPAFAAALRGLDLLRSIDEELGAFLEIVHAANLERNGELRAELVAAVHILNRAGLEPVLLKGGIRLADELYPDDGWRTLRDLDILVPEAMLAQAIRALKKAGYASHRLDGEVRLRGRVCQIDLHSELFGTQRQIRLLPAHDVLHTARPVVFEEARLRIPTIEHQFIHLVGHSQIRHFGHAFGHVSFRNRLEAAALVQWGGESIDWQAVLARFVEAGYRRPLVCFLGALNDGAWCAVPPMNATDPLAALQRRRIALQARSAIFDHVGSRVAWGIFELRRQVRERDGCQRRAIKNLRRLIFERGAARRMARAFLERQQHLMHALPHLSWIVAQ